MKRQLSADEIKQVELDILLAFKKACLENHLKFYLVGGTLLGAVRHKGFIPWDDDIDAGMPRPAYNKLIRLEREKKILPDHLKLICHENGTFQYPFIKIVDTRTTVDQKYLEGNVAEHLWIDVFPYIKYDFYAVVYNCGKTFFRKLVKPVLTPIARKIGPDRCCRAMDRLTARYPFSVSRYCGGVVWGLYGPGERMVKDEFMKSDTVTFEGHRFPAMSCWDSYLSGLYKNYMELPPEDKRVTHEMTAWIEEPAE